MPCGAKSTINFVSFAQSLVLVINIQQQYAMDERKSLESSLSHTEIHDSHPPKAEQAAPKPDGEAPIAGSVKPDHPVEDDYKYVTGFKLATIIGCVTLVAFLILLDQSIIATVRHAPPAFCNPA